MYLYKNCYNIQINKIIFALGLSHFTYLIPDICFITQNVDFEYSFYNGAWKDIREKLLDFKY
jgi:hypothetical protein